MCKSKYNPNRHLIFSACLYLKVRVNCACNFTVFIIVTYFRAQQELVEKERREEDEKNVQRSRYATDVSDPGCMEGPL